MAINIVTPPTGGAPLSTSDYDAQNTLIQALLYTLNKETRFLTEWDTTDEPSIKEGVYIQHGGSLYLVEDSDESISGSPGDGRVYVKLTEAAGIITASFVTSTVGYSWNDVYNGFYHADGTQLLPVVIVLSGTGTVWVKYLWDHNTDIKGDFILDGDGDVNGNLNIQDKLIVEDEIQGYGIDDIKIKEQAGTGTVSFYIKKPITAYIIGTSPSSHFDIYQNSGWRTITSGITTTYMLWLNPGYYRLLTDTALWCTGVFGAITVTASEIVT